MNIALPAHVGLVPKIRVFHAHLLLQAFELLVILPWLSAFSALLNPLHLLGAGPDVREVKHFLKVKLEGAWLEAREDFVLVEEPLLILRNLINQVRLTSPPRNLLLKLGVANLREILVTFVAERTLDKLTNFSALILVLNLSARFHKHFFF